MEDYFAYALLNSPSEDIAFLRDERGVERFVHFTPVDNLASILTHGLLTRKQLEDNDISHAYTDDNRFEGIDVINLSITNPNIRMFYRKRKEVPSSFAVISIDPSVLCCKDVEYRFTTENAASRRAQPCNAHELFAGARPTFFQPNWPTNNQSELLIKGSVPAECFLSIQLESRLRHHGETAALVIQLQSLANKMGLTCSIEFNDELFEYDERFLETLGADSLADASEQKAHKAFDNFYNAWDMPLDLQERTRKAIEAASCTQLFDSIAVPRASLATDDLSASAQRTSGFTWSMTYSLPDPEYAHQRNNQELSAFAVMEKIIHRGRKTVLSIDLESKLGGSANIFAAHQTQASFLELAKQQTIGPGTRIGIKSDPATVKAYRSIATVALDDLKHLDRLVASLYRTEPLFENVSIVDAEDADFILNWSNDTSGRRNREAVISWAERSEAKLDYSFTKVTEPASINANTETLSGLLRYIFGFETFREGQVTAIKRALRREDSIVLLPTGSGKSIVFQMVALITPGMAFVVCPIISLIEDQIINLRASGVDRISGITSQSTQEEKRQAGADLANCQTLICYVAPERFQNRVFTGSVKKFASTNLISAIAIDEAHCVSEWGHDFRTAYLGLADACRDVCRTNKAVPPLLALTGTASSSVLVDMRNDLGIKGDDAIIQPNSFDRPEIHFRIIPVGSSDKMDALANLIQNKIPAEFNSNFESFYKPDGSDSYCGIVFCPHTSGNYGIQATSAALNAGHPGVWDSIDSMLPGIACFYSGKRPPRVSSSWDDLKRQHASEFKHNEKTIMVATKAFGMGIDKPNVRWIVHFGLSGSLESYYQEVGRAARDRNISYAYLLVSDDHPAFNDRLLDPSQTNVATISGDDEKKKGKWNGDDVSRILNFHTNTFSGIEDEMRTAENVLRMCGSNNFVNGEWRIAFDSKNKNSLEKAIHRFRILGVFQDYSIEYGAYGGGDFLIVPAKNKQGELRDTVVSHYLQYVAQYQSDLAYLNAAKQNLLADLSAVPAGREADRQFIMRALRHLLTNFTYKILEEGRRRAVATMLDAARKAAAGNTQEERDEIFRSRLLAYLSTTGGEGGEEVSLRALINNATSVDLTLKVFAKYARDGELLTLLGQTSRLLEDYPQHFALHFLRACVHATQSDMEAFSSSTRAMLEFGQNNYNLSRNDCALALLRFLQSSGNGEFDDASADEGNKSEIGPQMADTLYQLLQVVSLTARFTFDSLLDLVKSPAGTMLKTILRLDSIATEARKAIA